MDSPLLVPGWRIYDLKFVRLGAQIPAMDTPEFLKELSGRLGRQVNGADIMPNNIFVSLPITERDHDLHESLPIVEAQLIDTLRAFGGEFSSIAALRASVRIAGSLPNFLVSFPNVTLVAGGISFRDVSEVISCQKLLIMRPNLVSGPVLDLLRIRGLTEIIFRFPTMFAEPTWSDIVARHVGGDILACQEELIDAGQEEFAEL